jgi:cell division protein FtsL
LTITSSSLSPSLILISFSPEQFIYFVIAIATATTIIIVWVYRQTHSLDKRLESVEKDIKNIQKELDEQKPRLRDMEIMLARLTGSLSRRVRFSSSKEEEEEDK